MKLCIEHVLLLSIFRLTPLGPLVLLYHPQVTTLVPLQLTDHNLQNHQQPESCPVLAV